MKTSNGEDFYDIDWESAQMELQKEIELETKKQLEENEKKKQEEINTLKKDLEEEYSKRKNEMEEKLRKQVEEYQLQIKEINQNAEKQRIEQERLNQEKKLKEKLEQLEEEKAKKKREFEIKEKNEMIKREQAKKQQEFIHKSEKLENNLTNILKKISKMKIIINELKRNINLDVALQKNLLEELDDINTPTNIVIRVENYEEGTVYYWNTETFHNRYDLMKELFNKFNDDDLDIQNLKKEDDPLWDEGKPVLLGYAFYKLEPVAYLMDNQSIISIVSPNGNVVGKIEVDIIPHDENGNEYDEVPEVPSELIGQSLLYKVVIMNIKNLPKNLSNNVTVQYQCFCDHSIISTKVYNPYNEKNDETLATNNTDSVENNNNSISGEEAKVDIEINETFEHKIDYLTKEDIEFLENDKVCFKIFSTEKVEKKGKTPFEEILNSVKEPQDLKEPEEEIKRTDGNAIPNGGQKTEEKKADDEPVDEMNNKVSKDNKKKGDGKDKGKKGKKKPGDKEDCSIF